MLGGAHTKAMTPKVAPTAKSIAEQIIDTNRPSEPSSTASTRNGSSAGNSSLSSAPPPSVSAGAGIAGITVDTSASSSRTHSALNHSTPPLRNGGATLCYEIEVERSQPLSIDLRTFNIPVLNQVKFDYRLRVREHAQGRVQEKRIMAFIN